MYGRCYLSVSLSTSSSCLHIDTTLLMPPRIKRNANISRRHHSAAHSPLPLYDSPSPAQDLLSFDQDDPAQTAYGAMTRPPAVFDPDPPPSDPDV